MLKHNNLDKYWSGDLVLFISYISIHIPIKIITLDLNTNQFGACVILFIIKHHHEHRKHFKHMCQYILLSVLTNIVEYTTNQILEVKTLDLIDND